MESSLRAARAGAGPDQLVQGGQAAKQGLPGEGEDKRAHAGDLDKLLCSPAVISQSVGLSPPKAGAASAQGTFPGTVQNGLASSIAHSHHRFNESYQSRMLVLQQIAQLCQENIDSRPILKQVSHRIQTVVQKHREILEQTLRHKAKRADLRRTKYAESPTGADLRKGSSVVNKRASLGGFLGPNLSASMTSAPGGLPAGHVKFSLAKASSTAKQLNTQNTFGRSKSNQRGRPLQFSFNAA